MTRTVLARFWATFSQMRSNLRILTAESPSQFLSTNNRHYKRSLTMKHLRFPRSRRKKFKKTGKKNTLSSSWRSLILVWEWPRRGLTTCLSTLGASRRTNTETGQAQDLASPSLNRSLRRWEALWASPVPKMWAQTSRYASIQSADCLGKRQIKIKMW